MSVSGALSQKKMILSWVLLAGLCLSSCNLADDTITGSIGGGSSDSSGEEETIPYLIATFEDSSLKFFSPEVDWDNKLIYSASADGSKCLSIVSFADTNNIQLVAEINSTSTPAQLYGDCRQLKLYDDYSKLLVAANGANRLLRYDLGSTPEDPSTWGATVGNFLATGGSYVREIQKVSTNGTTTDVFFAAFTGWFHVSLTEATHSFTEIAKYTGTTSNNTSAFLENESLVLTQRYSSSTTDITVTELATGSVSTVLSGSIPNANGNSTVIWTAFSSEDGTKHALLGNYITFIDSSSGTPVVVRREKPKGLYRDSKSVRYGGKDYLYAISNQHFLDVYDVTSASNPTLLTRTEITELGSYESYGIDVNMAQNLAVIGTTTGKLAIIDLRGLTTPTSSNDYIPELTISDASGLEATGSVDVTLTLDAPSTLDVSVDYTTNNGTATAGADYTAVSGTLTFSAGETSKTVSIPLTSDGSPEGSETLTLDLSSPSSLVIIDNQATVTIND